MLPTKKLADPGVNPTIFHQWSAYCRNVAAFVRDCVWIYDATAQDWVRFEL